MLAINNNTNKKKRMKKSLSVSSLLSLLLARNIALSEINYTF